MNIGIYCISFDGLNEVYIGQSMRLKERWHDHLYSFKTGKCSNNKLLNAYNNYGEPIFEIIELCSLNELDKLEEYWIKEFDSYTNGLNLVPGSISSNGLNSGNSILTEECIVSIFNDLLIEPVLTLESIASKYEVSSSRVSDIQSGSTHVWLKDRYPEQYILMKSLISKRIDRKVTSIGNTKTYIPIVVDKLGNEYIIDNVSKFAKEHNVDIGNFCKMLYGTTKYKCVKGFSLKDKTKPMIKEVKNYPNLISPEGVEYEVTNMAQFARDHGLTECSVGKLIRGGMKSHKGYKVKVNLDI